MVVGTALIVDQDQTKASCTNYYINADQPAKHMAYMSNLSLKYGLSLGLI